MVLHNIEPIYDENSKILILGSFPSVKSRESEFFYAHPQNRFWKVTSAVFNMPLPITIDDKKAFLSENKIALWDVIASCEIDGSSDSSIKNALPNEIERILDAAKIRKIFVNGRTSERYYNSLIKDRVNRSAIFLPSTSPANAAWSTQRLIEAWTAIKL